MPFADCESRAEIILDSTKHSRKFVFLPVSNVNDNDSTLLHVIHSPCHSPIHRRQDVLFPYALAHVRAHLADTWTEPGTQTAVRLLRTEAAADALAAVPGAIAVPDACETDAERSAQIDALVRVVEWQMAADRKATPLKMLQGQIWAKAYQCGLIQGQ